MESTVKHKHLYFDEGSKNFLHVFEAPNLKGTTVQYRVTVFSAEFFKNKDRIASVLATLFEDTIHPLVAKIYDLTQKQDTLTFHPEIVFVDESEWSFYINLQLDLDHNTLQLQITPTCYYISYETSNHISEPSLVSLKQQYIDWSSVDIKVDTKNPIDGKYKVSYEYTKRVQKAPSTILKGIEDIFALHFKYMFYDSFTLP